MPSLKQPRCGSLARSAGSESDWRSIATWSVEAKCYQISHAETIWIFTRWPRSQFKINSGIVEDLRTRNQSCPKPCNGCSERRGHRPSTVGGVSIWHVCILIIVCRPPKDPRCGWFACTVLFGGSYCLMIFESSASLSWSHALLAVKSFWLFKEMKLSSVFRYSATAEIKSRSP